MLCKFSYTNIRLMKSSNYTCAVYFSSEIWQHMLTSSARLRLWEKRFPQGKILFDQTLMNLHFKRHPSYW